MGIPVLSFFTGGGLLDIGFEEAGFRVVWTNEANHVFADMYEYAMTAFHRSNGTDTPPAKISSRRDISKLYADAILRQAFGRGPVGFFGMIGGPPCPDFSIGGRNGGHKGSNGRLTRIFVNRICQIKPDFFVIENVPGLFRTKKHRQFLDSMILKLQNDGGYMVDRAILKGLELGIPQDRERLFIVGFSNRLAYQELSPTQFGWFPWPTAIYPDAKSLPWPGQAQPGTDPVRPKEIPEELTVYPLLAGEGSPEDLPNGKDCFVAYSEKFRTRLEGDVRNKSFKRLHRHRYSPTLWFGNNEVPLHPWKPRRLSVREALRIQTVPDSYVLPDGVPLSSKFKLVCNGVPCRMAEQLAREILGYLRELGAIAPDPHGTHRQHGSSTVT